MMEKVLDIDRAAIAEVWRQYVRNVEAGDLEGWLALWVDEGIQMPPAAERRRGLMEISVGNKPLFDLFDSEMSIHPDGIEVLGDTAYSYGLYQIQMTPKEGGDPIEVDGKFLTILKKQPDGSWKIAIDCFNDNQPPG